ncbi:hypothetical protein M413DRAFT_18946 [Hebeloma cylindrosporum]|uniref:FAD-binding domain-containing protein n=1 Tax=Hebeloma cylindrosporum TaxID=76867 RepID=A0A0C3CCS6_HEBCY|nr:hypothetical protein M413DRAFT_18946 [Hebeloma cylindrosporum h7]
MGSSDERLRIAIIGAGVGGLTLSAALRSMNHENNLDVNIYEASSRISPIGAGINFWARTWGIAKAIGLEEKLSRLIPRGLPEGLIFEVRKSDQENGVYVQGLMSVGGALRIHRADLQRALIESTSGQLHLSHRLLSYEETDDEIQLHFQDGQTASCDLLVGMDGIKSVVRKCFLVKQGLGDSPSMHPFWTGSFAYRGLVPIDKLEAAFPGHRVFHTPMMYCGKFKHLVAYPISQDKLINIVCFVTHMDKEGAPYDGPTTSPCTQEEVLDTFKGWEEEVLALLRCIEKPTKWAIRALHPLDKYASGRVVIAGDAAHAMTPHQGSGAGQAIEDAYILSSLICANASSSSHTKVPIPRISEIYNTIRQPLGNRVLAGSRTAGLLCQLVAPGLEDVVEGDRDVPREKLLEVFGMVGREWAWTWEENVEDDRRRALDMLRARPGEG